jgi:hypothetical protein
MIDLTLEEFESADKLDGGIGGGRWGGRVSVLSSVPTSGRDPAFDVLQSIESRQQNRAQARWASLPNASTSLIISGSSTKGGNDGKGLTWNPPKAQDVS